MATPSGSNGAPKGEDGQPSSSRFSSSSSSRLEVTDLTLQLLETITNNFSDEHKVGTGGYGKVYRGKYNGHEIAVKKLYIMHGLDDEDFKNEFRQLMKVQHENIIRLIAYCHEIKHKYVEDNGELIFAKVIDRALCFEYMQEGSLDRHISDHSCIHDWATTYKIIRGTCEGLHYLHKGRGEGNYIYHMDLKPDNILLDKDMTPKITDFGLSRLFGKSKTHQTCSLKMGTLGFMPPEYINNGTISPKNDVFSLGVIIFYLLAGQIGYVDYCDGRYSRQEFIERVQEYWKKKMHAEPYYIWEEIDLLGVKICIELAMSCVVMEREKRPSTEDIIYELQKLDTQTDNMSKRDSGQAYDIGEYDDGEDYDKEYNDGESSLSSESISTILSSLEMTDQVTELKALESILLDANAKPAKLSYPFIRNITRNFSQEIGRGGFGVVYLGDIGTGKVAVKRLSIAQGFSDKIFADEINCLIRTKHRNIVRFLGYCAESHGEMVPFNRSCVLAEVPQRLLCFEYVPKGNLQKYLKDTSHKDEWPIRYQMIRGICNGLNYLHGQRIIHLDLKPDNILLDAHMNPKITDFGISRCFDEGVSRIYTVNIRGTKGSIAPETIDSGEITFKSDIYGLGNIIINLLTGRNKYDFENWHTSLDVDGPQVRGCIEIAKACADFDQRKRPAIGEIMKTLNEIEKI